jgi:hypothetical protein
MSTQLVKFELHNEFKGVRLLADALNQLADVDGDRLEAARTDIFNLTVETSRRLALDLNTPIGAEQAKEATALLINLGLDYLVRTTGRTAVDILSKNALAKIWPIGVRLVEDNADKAGKVWNGCVVRDATQGEQSNLYFGLLPFELERKILVWKQFAPCATVEELDVRNVQMLHAERLIALGKHLPVKLVASSRGVIVILTEYQFVRWHFARPARNIPSPHGGIVELLTRTIMVKSLLGKYSRWSYMGSTEPNWKNWMLEREEILTFVDLVINQFESMNARAARAVTNLEEYFVNDAWSCGAMRMKEGEIHSWGEILQAIFLGLIEAVRNFYSTLPQSGDVSKREIDKFWGSRVILRQDFVGKGEVYEYQVPRLDQLLRLSLANLREPLAGFWFWPAEFRQNFIARYPFTAAYLEADRQLDFMRAGENLVEIIQLMVAPIVGATNENDTSTALATRSGEAVHWGKRVFARLDLSRLKLQLVYSLFVNADDWVRDALLDRVPDYHLSLKGFQAIMARGAGIRKKDVTAPWFHVVLKRLCDTELLTSNKKHAWGSLLHDSVAQGVFPVVLEFCPTELCVPIISSMLDTTRMTGLNQLSNQQRSELMRLLNKEYVEREDSEVLVRSLMHEIERVIWLREQKTRR